MRYTLIGLFLVALGVYQGLAVYGIDTPMDKAALALFVASSLLVGLVEHPVKRFIPSLHGKK